MSVTMSPPVRIFAFVGGLAAVGLAVFFFVIGRMGTESVTLPTTPTALPEKGRTTSTTSPARTTRPSGTRPARVPASGFPLPIDRALRRHGVAVVVVYMPRSGVDAIVRREARAGAIASHAGFVAVSALSERLVRPLVAKTGVLPDPAVLVLKRPGVVKATLSVTDRRTVAQAVLQARR